MVPGYQTSITLSQIDGTYMLKAVNIAGIESNEAAKITVDIPDEANYKTVQVFQADPDFAGTFEQTFKTTENQIKLDGPTLWDSIPDNIDDWTVNLDDISGKYLIGNFTSSQTIDLGYNFTSKLVRVLTGSLSAAGYNWDDIENNIDDWDNIDGNTTLTATIVMLFRYTKEDPVNNNWSDWIPLTVNEVKARAFQFRVEIFTSNKDEIAVLEQMRANINMIQRTEQRTESITTSNQNVFFAKRFYEIPHVSVLINNGVTGDYASISNITTTGFEVTTYNSSGAQANKTISFVATGYGES
jgi:hypothetical protein